ncbi:MAG: transposase [Planctomycetaceae bacterium]
MPLAHHVVLTAYGFWLPNDPRGSGSRSVGSWDLFQYGGATRLEDFTASVAHAPHDHLRRIQAKQSLQHPPVCWTGQEALTIATSFRDTAAQSHYRIYAFAILPDHIHLVICEDVLSLKSQSLAVGRPLRTSRSPHRIAGHLRSQATRALRSEHRWPTNRPIWSKRSFVRFLDTPEEVRMAMNYVNDNPEKSGRPRQHWSFVSPLTVDQ